MAESCWRNAARSGSSGAVCQKRRPMPVLALLAAMLLCSACVPLGQDEASLLLEDLAAGERDSRLKARVPAPVHSSIGYQTEGRSYQGELYRPGEPAQAGIVLVPGAARAGKDDPRLVALANTLARARFLVLVPEIPNLRALKVRAADARVVADAFAHLLDRPELPDGSRAGIGAFSYAVGPAVLSALESDIRDRVDFVFGVGGYHDLHRVVTFFTTGYFRQDGRWQYLQPNRYGKWVFVLGNVERLSDSRDRQVLRRIAEYQLQEPAGDVDHLRTRLTAEGRAVLALLENQDPAHTSMLIAGLPVAIRTELDALNLANKNLSRLYAQLILLHGPDDAIIPYTESIALADAVPAGQSRLFIIDGLAHVDVRPLGIDRGEMRRAIDALLTERDRQ